MKRTQVGELSLPAAPGPHPVVVLLHGGFWHAMYGRRLMSKLAADLAARAVAAWNLDYRGMGGGGGWPATFDDVAAGIDALVGIPSLDLTRVTAVGHSAGGQLALWAAARPSLPAGVTGSAPAVTVTAAVAPAWSTWSMPTGEASAAGRWPSCSGVVRTMWRSGTAWRRRWSGFRWVCLSSLSTACATATPRPT